MKKKLTLVAVLAALVAIAATLEARFARAESSPRVIEITAKRFEFSPAEITLKKDQPVTLRLTSQDVKHGFFAKGLNLDGDIEPGKPTELTFTPHTAGKYVTVCDDFCGAGHGDMRMAIVVE